MSDLEFLQDRLESDLRIRDAALKETIEVLSGLRIPEETTAEHFGWNCALEDAADQISKLLPVSDTKEKQ